MKLLKKFVSTALLAGSAAMISAATPLINLVGDQAPLVISFDDVPSMIKACGDSPWAKTWNDEQVRKFFAPLHAQMKFEEFDAKVKAETGHTFSELIEFATGDALIALTTADIDFEAEDADDNIPLVIAVDLGANASKVEKLLEDDRKKNPDNTHETEDFAGVTLHIETSKEGAKGPSKAYWTLTDGVWIFGFHKDTILSAIDAFKKGGAENAFGKSDSFLSARNKGGQSHLSMFVNFKPIVAKAQQEIAKKAAQSEQSNPFLNPVAIIPALGLDAWNQMYFNIHFTDAQTVATGGFTFSEERGLLKMFSYGHGPVARPAFVPAKWMAVSSGKFSLKNFYSGLEEMLGAYNPGVLGMGQMYVKNFNEQLGIDIKRDFFGSFGPDMISGYAPRAGASKTASMDELDQFVGLSLDNPKAFTTALDALLKMGGPQAEQMIVKREFLGSTINTIAVPSPEGQPAKSFSYAIAKNYLMLSIGTAGAIESALQSGPSFWERSEVKKALASIPGDASSFTYQDTSALIGTVFQSFVQLAANPASQGQSPVDASAAPDVSTLSKYWGDTVGYLTRDSQGYFFKTTLEHKK
ncbi:DUF3352 domain-containing protein [Nibricoccus aquaticus]|nr:DUF3352 domain-containing protein [Nibricoccus aquaticus]